MLLCNYYYLKFLFLTALCGGCHGFLKCDCASSKCTEARNCTAGTVMDQCGCCAICAKDEGETCGGLNHVEGECGRGMQCMVRDVQNWINRLKRLVQELVGRCEYTACHTIRCPVGKSCLLVSGLPTCQCPLCRNMVTEEVCGESNGKLYKNECELRRDECLTGSRIGMGFTPCISGPGLLRTSTQCQAGKDGFKRNQIGWWAGTNGREVWETIFSCSFGA